MIKCIPSFLALAAFLILFQPALAKEHQVPQGFPPISQFIDSQTTNLVVINLDNLLTHTSLPLAEDPVRKELERKLMHRGVPRNQIPAKAAAIWEYIQDQAILNPLLKDAATVIGGIQKEKVPTLGMTDRGADSALRTTKELSEVGIRFSMGKVKISVSTIKGSKGSQLIDGILYVGPLGNSVQSFYQMVNQINFIPQKLYYVDDNAERLEAIRKVLLKMGGVEFIGIHYEGTARLEKVSTYKLEKTQKWDFDKILADPGVQKIINSPGTPASP